VGPGPYLVAVVLCALALVPVALGSLSLRRRLLPDWAGAPARVAESVLFLALVWAVAQLLGLVGALERVPLVASLALAGVGAWWLGTRGAATPSGEPPPAPAPHRPGVIAAAVAAALVAAQWGVLVVEALGGGMQSSDTLSYHGPVAARFFQEGTITSLEFVYSDPIIAFLPYNSELIHAIGMLLFGRDVASPFINLGWLGLALLAAWCVGRPRGLGPASVLVTCTFLAAPALVTSQAGSAGNDIVAGALMLAAAALLLNSGWRTEAVSLAGVAAGLALAAKVTAIAPVAVLTVGVILAAPRARRLPLGVAWTAATVVAGSFWYLRNLARVGNPFPAVEIEIGPLSLPSPPLPETFTVSDYLTDSDIWREFYLPGLNASFGEAWWGLVALAALGMLAAAIAGRPLERALGFAALTAVAVYLVTPRSADGPEEVPFFFQFTLRYMTPGLVIGLALLPVLRPLSALARRWWFYLGVGVLLVVTLLDSGIRTGDMRRVALAAAFGALAAAILVAPRRLPRRTLAVAVAAVLATGAAAGYAIQRDYLDDRYTGDALAFARELRGERIAVVGFVRAYPLFGERLSNRVEQVAHRGPNGAFLPIRACRTWRTALADGGYRYVVTSPPLLPYSAEGVIFGAAFDPKTSPERRWTGSDPAATPIAREGKITVFRLDGPPDPGGCSDGRG
jgi:hypothetical protein